MKWQIRMTNRVATCVVRRACFMKTAGQVKWALQVTYPAISLKVILNPVQNVENCFKTLVIIAR
jgi:hypothetical protein